MALVGRDEIVSEIAGQLLRRRLVTITRAGGIGKTAVALAIGTHSQAPFGTPPASSSRTLTAGFSANLRATTQPEDPAPQTMKS
jgi:hypothetical protein